MRSDNRLPEAFRSSSDWLADPATGEQKPQIDRLRHYFGPDYHRHSYSGHERNKFFLNREGREFVDISGITGADTEADSRSWCVWDYDRDGWIDIAVVNANTPLFNLYRSCLGEQGAGGGVIAVRLIGGNHSASASNLSNRDGVGAVVTVTVDGKTITRVRRCGEGFAAQNSETMLIGIGSSSSAAEVKVTWPSGRVTSAQSIPAGTLLVCSESEGRISQKPYRVAQ